MLGRVCLALENITKLHPKVAVLATSAPAECESSPTTPALGIAHLFYQPLWGTLQMFPCIFTLFRVLS